MIKKNIFSENFGRTNWRFLSRITGSLCKKSLGTNVVFQFFCRKPAKIAEIGD
jgi:hypothetical protein